MKSPCQPVIGKFYDKKAKAKLVFLDLFLQVVLCCNIIPTILRWKSENQVSFLGFFLKFCRRRIYLTNWLEIWSRWQRHHIGLSGLKCPWWKSGIRSHCDPMVIWKTVWRCIFYASLWVLNEYAGLCSKIMSGSGCLLGVSILCNIGGA